MESCCDHSNLMEKMSLVTQLSQSQVVITGRRRYWIVCDGYRYTSCLYKRLVSCYGQQTAS